MPPRPRSARGAPPPPPPAWPVVFPEAPPHLAALSLPERLGVVAPDEVARARGLPRSSSSSSSSANHAGPSSSVAQYAPAAASGYVLLHPPPPDARSRRDEPRASQSLLRSWPAPQQPPVSPTASFCPPTPSSSISSRSTGTTAASSLYSLPSPTSAYGSFHAASKGGTGAHATTKGGSPSCKSYDGRASCDSFPYHGGEVTGLGLDDELAAASGLDEGDRWHLDDYFIYLRTTIRGRERAQRTHAFPLSQVPYRQTYGQETMAGQMIWHLLSYDLLQSHCLTSFPDGIAPRRVLDIGCGEGSWVTDLARTPGWEQTELVGLDVVPCQTPLHDRKLAQRVSWVVANAFDGLSMFPDGSFDFVHMRFMGGNSVPEEKLTDLIDTMVRLTAPGGRIEILEADTIFLGTPHLIPASDIKALVSGQASITLRNGPPDPLSRNRDFDALERCTLRNYERHGVSLSPLSIIPACISMHSDLTDTRLGNPRCLPLLADPATQLGPPPAPAAPPTPAASGAASDAPAAAPPSAASFTTRAQIGAPLPNATFQVLDLDMVRSMLVAAEALFHSANRELLWEDTEAEKHEVLRQPHTGTSADGVTADGRFVHPWPNKASFMKVHDIWTEKTWQRAAVGRCLERTTGKKRPPLGPDFLGLGDPCAPVPHVSPAGSPNASPNALPHDTAARRSSVGSTTQPPSRSTSFARATRGSEAKPSATAAAPAPPAEATTPVVPTIPVLAVKRTTGFTAVRRDQPV